MKWINWDPLNRGGSFKELRFYDKDRYLIHEIAYHPEPNINNGNRRDPVFRLPNYNRKFKRTDAVRIHRNSALHRKIKPYLKDIKI